MRRVNLFFFFLAAPLIGVLIAVSSFSRGAQGLELPVAELQPAVGLLADGVYQLRYTVGSVHESLEEQQQRYEEQQELLRTLAAKSAEHKQLSDDIYEQHILDKLGPPVRVHRSARVEVKIFELKGIGYRGYIAKVKPFDPGVLRVTYREGPGETTSEAVRRTGAVLGVNGGGFYRAPVDGLMHTLPIGNTMVDGKLVGGFQPPREDLFFAGFDGRGRLVGGIFNDRTALLGTGARQGVSFVPILIKDRQPVPIPEKWRNQRQPRTILGEYANGDLIMIVVDGRQADWSSGVTLEDLQVTLIKFGVIDAYNLDGGGSSVFVFGNQILNRPSDGRERVVATNIVVLP
ncbi:phosphodiester glycosidase family protein [Candidatus Desulforudis audaxviator]|uniref:N-acetylglucosamine-1-phosphodiester alpha-N-acetylglucosaminidase-like exopolysaccharide biosynthesis protein n=1 Tax=Desulforudis audaxviator (strain MP104C) TaxID=477974 RepID=B1I1S0_DESAP|nr:phosphodiester glycosidase family protein [Candidatus Desulforudis audaxviator]ACA58991.1 N-acetylglucosamine-1-phosphodiester alpha-N-acetylglucosaminidase-like exopolysaccharide biosynthesis protein [Candidatus Desulforudis audaxviator MP104C]AZK59031.1 phosphodiester glycosidase family protein [Candidatus Desulforudis audaxviator]